MEPDNPAVVIDLVPWLDPNFEYPPGVLSPPDFAYACLGIKDKLYACQVLALEAYGQGLPLVLCPANGTAKTHRVIAIAILWPLTYSPLSTSPLPRRSRPHL